jgi:hypothetical protein
MTFFKRYILHDPVNFELAADATVFGSFALGRTHHVELGGLNLLKYSVDLSLQIPPGSDDLLGRPWGEHWDLWLQQAKLLEHGIELLLFGVLFLFK